ncbi:hypothetical protein GGQ76_001499 [Aureimonas jatrophae]|uniref:hypothetical protein n=1 Tax=Aureimonas jatrophae TaxID=1166073 RepID=UPI001606773A|nr:hypothetical protein [Aureimonas jatrophae]MBB3950208.1 hypothetical protein [Aureimonas jatrophae]
MDASERRAILKVERGLSSLTYRADAGSLGDGPVAEVVAVSPGLRLVSAPGEPDALLRTPGRVLVIAADQPGTIEVVLRAARAGATLAATLELTRMGAEAEPSPEPRLRPSLAEGGVEFLLRAHVSLRGDLAAPRGHWICGPDAPGRIEGLEMRAVGEDLPIEYQVAVAGRGAGWSNWTPAGAYAGTRGKALPLIGLRARLTAAAAPGLALRADGAFLGASLVTRRGRDVELLGPTPLDPLVGLRLDFVSALEPVAGSPSMPPVRQPSRLRVFRRPQPEREAA